MTVPILTLVSHILFKKRRYLYSFFHYRYLCLFMKYVNFKTKKTRVTNNTHLIVFIVFKIVFRH